MNSQKRQNTTDALIKVVQERGILYLIKSCLFRSYAFKIFFSNFLLTYSLRAGISLVLRILRLTRSNPKALFSLKTLLEESNFRIREEAVRTGLFIGLFTSIYRVIVDALGRINFLRFSDSTDMKEVKSCKYHSAIGGFIAGISILIMDKSWHKSLALYTATRAAQSLYNFNKEKESLKSFSICNNHGDTLLFAVSSAQILYSYVMRPETLPKSYYHFILKQGPYTEFQLRFVRSSIRNHKIDSLNFMKYIISDCNDDASIVANILPYVFLTNKKMITKSNVNLLDINDIMKYFKKRSNVGLIPLQGLHSYTTNTLLHTWKCFTKVAKFIFPVYFSLALVPTVVLRFSKFTSRPLESFLKSFFNAIQSTTFLSLFCALYQTVVNIQRMIIERIFERKIKIITNENELSSVIPYDHKFIYWFAGFIASFSLLLEKKNRRSELALYALPRAIDSLFLLLVDRKLMITIPFGEVLLFSSSMGIIMYFYENSSKALSPLLKSILSIFFENTLILQKNQYLTNKSSSQTSIVVPL